MNNYKKLLEFAEAWDYISFEYRIYDEKNKLQDMALIKWIVNIIEIDLIHKDIYISLGGWDFRNKGIEDEKWIIKFSDHPESEEDIRKYWFVYESTIIIDIIKLWDQEWINR